MASLVPGGNDRVANDTILAQLLTSLDGAPAASMLDVSYSLLRSRLGIRSLALYVADYSEENLHVVPSSLSPPPAPESIAVRGTVPGRVYMTRETVETEAQNGRVVWVPVFRRSESIGVLALGLEDGDQQAERLAPAIALIVGAAVMGARRHSDVFELARGADQLRLAAAMQWDLLPLPTYKDPRVEIAGRVEPAYDIGGDAFDFASNDGTVELAVFDAMGHGLRATLLTTLAVGAYRFGRRRRSELEGVAGDIDEAVLNQVEGEAFVTGHLCRLALETGILSWVNAGHPIPLLVRDHAAAPLGEAEPTLPFGLEGSPDKAAEVHLQPGDIVLFYSDGVIEARENGGPEYSLERFLDMAGRHGDPEAALLLLVRQILDNVLEHAQGVLRDDATLVALRWSGPPGQSPSQ